MQNRNWTVLLIGGASGSGKSSISYPLGKLYEVGVLEVDDFQVMLETMTKPEMLPALHYWNTHPQWQQEGAEATVRQLINVGKEMLPGLVSVINNHLETDMPVILEGDFLLPELAATFQDARVASFFVHEPEKEQYLRNYLQREPEAGQQAYRAEVSWRYSHWLAESCQKLHLPVIQSRPWDTLLARAVDCIAKK